jgi:hypothetical protein
MTQVSISTNRFANKVASTLLLLLELAAGMLLVLCATGQPAKAYADPSSGALLWQLFFASIVSVGFHFRKVRLWLTRRRTRR